MAQQRQRQGGFRFSFPWMAAQAAHQATSSQPSAIESRSTPAPRQPLRVVPSQNSNQQQTPPPQAQTSKDIENQKPSPSGASPQPRAINSQPPSTSRIGTQSRPTSRKPSRNFSNTKSTLQKSREPESPPKINPSTTPISNENEQKLEEPKPEVEAKKEEKNHDLGEKSEEIINGKEIGKERINSNDKRFTLSTGTEKPNVSHKYLASDNDKQTFVEKENVVSTKDTLNPTSSPYEYEKTVISDVVDKDQAHIHHHMNTTTSENNPIHKGVQDDISRFVHKMTNEHQKLLLDKRQASVITLTGENRGALMTIDYESRKKERKINIYRGYKMNPHESNDSTTGGEKSSNEENTKGSKILEDEEPKAYMNSNIQSVNNSIMFNSSITERNPGVHFTMSRKVMEQNDDIKSNETLETHKTKFSVAQSQKLSYKPVVRRRCLRGLFMEPSDSDPDNPDKPRRHGCRVACREKNKIDVL